MEQVVKFPYNTEVCIRIGVNDSGTIFIMRETEKAYLMNYSTVINVTKGRRKNQNFSFWCPKSVWEDDRNFFEMNGDLYFNKPSFLK